MTRKSAAERVRKIAEGIDGTGTADQLEALAKELETDKRDAGSGSGLSAILSALAGIGLAPAGVIPVCACESDGEVRHIHPRTYQAIQSGEAGLGEPAKLAARIMFHASTRDSERHAMHALLDCINPDDGKQVEADLAIMNGIRAGLPELVEAAEWISNRKNHDKVMALDSLVRGQEAATAAGVHVHQRDPISNN